MNTTNVVPIPPSYSANGKFSYEDTVSYLKHLETHDVSTYMTTAGTSQYNLLSSSEIQEFNSCVLSFSGKKIIGIPALSTIEACSFIDSMGSGHKDTHYMGLYPDRFYDKKTIIDYFSSIRDKCDAPLYVHGMFMRAGRGGQWNFTSDVLSELFEKNVITGIKEEHSDLAQSYNMILGLPDEMDVIVAGGSMRRHQFLRTAGANSFLAGIGNLYPEVEADYCKRIDAGEDITELIEKESTLFSVFNKHGWHRSLRIGISELQLGCFYDRMPWPSRDEFVVEDILNVLEEIK